MNRHRLFVMPRFGLLCSCVLQAVLGSEECKAGDAGSCAAGSMHSVQSITETQRKNLGTPDFKEDMMNQWKDAEISIDDKELKIMGHPVMEEWERPYMKRLADISASKGGRVLELGFGMAISATYVQANPIKEHVIIDANAQVVERAKKWSETTAKSKVEIHHGFSWNITPELATDSFEGILYDTYPLKHGAANKHHLDFFHEARRLLKVGGVFTWFSPNVVDIPDGEKRILADMGFDCTTEAVKVPTPENCQYWRAKTIVAPTCIKTSSPL